MCGLAGVFYRNDRSPDLPALQAMSAALAHRGPDGQGMHLGGNASLVHRRLAILDSRNGRQPMPNETGLVQVVFNGEIYNFRELRRDLVSRSHRFRTECDTEVLVHLYEELGDDLVQRLRGMFAFAIWDARRERLVLARDRIGLKPLYYFRDDQKLLFGSEIKALLAHGDVDRSVDFVALDAYLRYGFVPGERTIFQRIKKLPPGHTLSISREHWQTEPRRYWRLEPCQDPPRSAPQWFEAVDAKLRETVAAHQIADVPVGAFLSGGLDSSAIVCLQSQVRADAVKTFSIGFAEQRFNELEYARKVAAHFETEHHDEIVTADAAEDLAALTHHFDEPFADSSAVPMMHLARLARQHVKVVVSGDGGDEAFGGYARYVHDLWEARWRSHLPRWFRRSVLRRTADRWPQSDWLPRRLRFKSALTNLSLDGGPAYANTVSIFRGPLRDNILSPAAQAQINGHRTDHSVSDAFAQSGETHPLAAMIAADVAVLLPDDFLTKVDRASMACGLEVRPPLVDHELLELTAAMPANLKIRGRETKWLLKRLFCGRLPADVLWRPKQGFEIPLDDWLRAPLRETFEALVFAPNALVGDWLNLAVVRRLYDQHLKGTGRHGQLLWTVLVLAAWAERYCKTATSSVPRFGELLEGTPH